MEGIENKVIVLKLNALWQPVGLGLVWKSVVDLAGGMNSLALDIEYAMQPDGSPDFEHPTRITPMTWEEWITVPVREWDLALHSPNLTIRVPTVLVAKNFKDMPIRRYGGQPNFYQVWLRDKGIDQYTGQALRESEASMDHVVPRSRGGPHTWSNVVLSGRALNWKKGNRLNSEVGLRLIRKPEEPRPIPASALLKDIRHPDWTPFIHKQRN